MSASGVKQNIALLKWQKYKKDGSPDLAPDYIVQPGNIKTPEELQLFLYNAEKHYIKKYQTGYQICKSYAGKIYVTRLSSWFMLDLRKADRLEEIPTGWKIIPEYAISKKKAENQLILEL